MLQREVCIYIYKANERDRFLFERLIARSSEVLANIDLSSRIIAIPPDWKDLPSKYLPAYIASISGASQ